MDTVVLNVAGFPRVSLLGIKMKNCILLCYCDVLKVILLMTVFCLLGFADNPFSI